MTLTNKSSRLKHWFLVALLFGSTLISLIPTEAWATPSGAGMTTFTSKNNGFYAGIYLRDCLNQTKQTKAVTSTDGSLAASRPPLSDYDKTSDNPGVDIGRYYAPNDGWLKDSQGCASVTDVNIALGNFGYSKASDFFLAMGYTANGTISIRTGTLSPVDYSLYVASSAQAVQNKINSRIASTYEQLDEDKFFVYDTVFGASGCKLNSTVSGSGTKATFAEVVEDPAGSGKFTTNSIDVEFPITTSTTPAPAGPQTSTTKEAEKIITAYDYGGKAGSTNDISCADLLTLRNKYASAMAKFDNNYPDKAIVSNVSAAATQNSGSDQATCVGGALGWLLCPIVTIMDNLNKSMANTIESMLRVDMMLPGSDSRTALQSIWAMLVGIANLLLVVAFLIVIFSQATSIGLSAYGIKKMLPRIIAAAILINLSFFVCGVLVDIFNIAGGAVKQIISVGIVSIPDASGAVSTSNLGVEIGSWIIGLSAAAVALTALALLNLIAFVLPVIATGTLATLGFFVAIALRQVLIVLLIVVSPIAIAAMILPNTESMFKKWMSGFIKLLALYPIVIAIMYGCTLVAKIILSGT